MQSELNQEKYEELLLMVGRPVAKDKNDHWVPQLMQSLLTCTKVESSVNEGFLVNFAML
jgi:hypothetical protein